MLKELPAYEINEFKESDRACFYGAWGRIEGIIASLTIDDNQDPSWMRPANEGFLVFIGDNGVKYIPHFKQCRKLEEIL